MSLETCPKISQPNKNLEPVPRQLVETEYFGQLRIDHYKPVIDGIRLHYTESGSGTRVIILGGLPLYVWEGFVGFIKPFSKKHTVNVLEYPGFGESQEVPDEHNFEMVTETLHQVIQQEGLGPAHIAALSFGAGTAIYLAAKHPEDVRSLSLMGVPIEFNPLIREKRSFLKHPAISQIAAKLIGNEKLWPAFFAFLISDPWPAKNLYGQKWTLRLAKKYASISPRAMLEYFHSILATNEEDWQKLCQQIKAPIAIVISRQEAEKERRLQLKGPHTTGIKLKPMLPHAELLINPDIATPLGHSKGLPFAQIVLPFLEKIDQRERKI